MSEQRHLKFVGQVPFSSTLLFMVDRAKLLTSELLEVAAGLAAHPAAAGRRGINDFTEKFRLMPNIPPPMVTPCTLQPCRVVTAQGALHVFHTESPDFGRQPGWARPVV